MCTISHIKKTESGEWEIQSNEEHLKGVAALCSDFADSFGYREYGEVMGLLHDIGKERTAFQQHIRKESQYDPDAVVDGDSSHAYIGGIAAKMLYPSLHPLISNPIMGHHRGLYDDGDWRYMLEQAMPEEIHIPSLDINLQWQPMIKEDCHLVERMLFSCLVDADYLDTESFMKPEDARLRGTHTSLSSLLDTLENYLQSLNASSPDTEVNKVRREVQARCREFGDTPCGFYSLTVPTGGGKTLSSLLWALKHAVKNGLKRVIIAIPYTSIITQTAATLKAIFGEENVLEHHSDFFADCDEDADIAKARKLGTENWDYPIIVTTNVQLFESLFSNTPAKCRKLHNIAKSVIILDEAQVLPTDYLQPIVDALKSLNRIFGSSVLFTTASQPVLSGDFRNFHGLKEVKEIIPEEWELHKKLRRSSITFMEGNQGYDEVAQAVSKHDRVLCIVNTRADAKEIYDRLPKDGLCLHLSRMMCPAHIKETIALLKAELKKPSESAIRVVSTQLIEAGVDIDFPVVFRQEAGLDSILQAAGRCNREGKMAVCPTYVFNLKKEKNLPPGFLTRTNNARLSMGQNHDWFSQEAMKSYFIQLYSRIDNFDTHSIAGSLYEPSELLFETAAKEFHLIEDNTISVFVNWRDSMELIRKLQRFGPSYPLMKALSQYSVNIRQKSFNTLKEAGAIEEPCEGIFVITDPSYYDDRLGLVPDNHWIEETLIV